MSATIDPIKRALTGQYRAALAMLRETIEKCPAEVWLGGEHPRTFWRITYHALFYTHLYAMQSEHDFVQWEKHKDCTDLWKSPLVIDPFTQTELIEYLDFIDDNITDWVNSLDLTSPECGFSWYKSIEKLDHQVLNIRHLSGHAGQLAEVVMRAGVEEISWSTRVPR
jgi:hypothetical protein